MQIELTSFDQLPELASIYVRSLEFNADEHWTDKSALRLLSDWHRRQPELFFTASADAQIMGGFVVGVRPWWDGNHLVDGELFVDPRYQKRGVAGALLRHTLQVAQAKYSPLLTWDTYTFRNDDFPLTWYKRIGFAEIEEWVMIRAQVTNVLTKLSP